MKEETKDMIVGLLFSTDRKGIGALIHWLEKETDYFTAPASTRFHGSYEGGLAEHSYNVYQCLSSVESMKEFKDCKFDDDSIIMVSLLHDLCKTNFYKVSMRNAKDEKTGLWVKVPFYEIEDTHPFGHGECSVMLIEKFVELADEERYAIRWHMGGFDESVRGGSYAIGKAFEKYPFALALHISDMMATYLTEK